MHATNKPFNIDKRLVYEAYKAVKSNRGAAGVDEQTIEQFCNASHYSMWIFSRCLEFMFLACEVTGCLLNIGAGLASGIGYRHV